MQKIDLEIKQQSLLESMVALVDLQLHRYLLCAAKLNWTDLTCGLQPPSLKTRLRNSRQLCGGKFRGHPQTPS